MPHKPLKDATLLAWRRIADSMFDVAFDNGITVYEITQLIRERAIRSAAKKVVEASGRASNSRIAIITGLPRSEIARVLTAKKARSSEARKRSPSNRVLAAWRNSADFQTASGHPATLPIFGTRKSFEKLVRLNGGGIPIRAMLDHLMQMGAVELLPDQRVKRKHGKHKIATPERGSVESIDELASTLIRTIELALRSRTVETTQMRPSKRKNLRRRPPVTKQ